MWTMTMGAMMSNGGPKKWTYIAMDYHAGILKIGKSDNPNRRVAQHRAGRTPGVPRLRDLNLCGIYPANLVPEQWLVDFVSKHLPKYRGLREWFEFDPDGDVSFCAFLAMNDALFNDVSRERLAG